MAKNNVLYFIGPAQKRKEGREQSEWRLVVPQTLVQSVLHANHNAYEGGHQGVNRTYMRIKRKFYWNKMHSDVEAYIDSCVDCSTGKGGPRLKGHSPGNLMPKRPFQIVSMDFVTDLPETERGNKMLLLFQDTFSGYVMAHPMATTTAYECAEAFEKCVFQRFGACKILRHDQDPRMMSSMFREFNNMMKQKQKATLSYRPQANGQQERSNKTIIQTVRLYIEDQHQRDWDVVTGRIMFAINNSYDHIRCDTPHYLVHGWDAKTTLEAVLPSPGDSAQTGIVRSNKATARETPEVMWRRLVQEDYKKALTLAEKRQKLEKKKRAEKHNAERRLKENEDGQRVEENIKAGDLVWLYINKVKTGYKKKLAHLWHGPFRVKNRDTTYSVELELPSAEGYRFFPRVHVARLKLKRTHPNRPIEELCVSEEARLNFDEALLPEDEQVAENEYEVEAILDEKLVRVARQGKTERRYLVKWRGYTQPSWEPEAYLSCETLLEEFKKKQLQKQRLAAMHLADQE